MNRLARRASDAAWGSVQGSKPKRLRLAGKENYKVGQAPPPPKSDCSKTSTKTYGTQKNGKKVRNENLGPTGYLTMLKRRREKAVLVSPKSAGRGAWSSTLHTVAHHRLRGPLEKAGLGGRVVKRLIERHALEESLLFACMEVSCSPPASSDSSSDGSSQYAAFVPGRCRCFFLSRFSQQQYQRNLLHCQYSAASGLC